MEELSAKKQLNIQKWLDIIHQCRDSGLSNQQWCEQNGISLKSYYYWLAKIRKMAIENIQTIFLFSLGVMGVLEMPLNRDKAVKGLVYISVMMGLIYLCFSIILGMVTPAGLFI